MKLFKSISIIGGLAGGLFVATLSHSLPVVEAESFENGLGSWSNTTSADSHDWILHSGSTTSNATGPDGASDGGRYLYMETSSGQATSIGNSVILESPAFDDKILELQFDYHMYGDDTGMLSVDVLSEGEWITDVWSLTGQQQSTTTEKFIKAVVDLSSYEFTYLRLKATAVGGFNGDIAIDNIIIMAGSDIPVPPHFKSWSIVKENATVNVPFSSDIRDDVADDNNDPLTFELISGPEWLVLSPTGELFGTPTENDTYANDFVVSISDGMFTTEGDLTIIVGDGLEPQILFIEDFETNNAVWINTIEDDNKNFTRHQLSTPSNSTGPTSGSVSKYYTYLETSSGAANNNGDTAILISPEINAANVYLTFEYHMYGANTGFLYVDVKTNGEWIKNVWSISGEQHSSGSDQYTYVVVDLDGYDVDQIRLRAVAIGGWQGDIALDNIDIIGIDVSRLDTDGDGTIDVNDLFPNDPLEAFDNDLDGVGDNADTDDDNDGTLDVNDAFPFDASETTDTDFDGLGNNIDTDDDNDGVLDVNDAFPLNASESIDTDNDGTGNNADTDDDGDGVLDVNDAFPFDASETTDTDLDGLGNNIDTDDDNDGVLDVNDAFPLNASESIDTDNDGTGNNVDTDDDGDSVLDVNDTFPLDSSEYLDTDGDGTGNNADLDDDNDGLTDADEHIYNTNPLIADTDEDKMPDGWEVSFGLNPLVDDANGDLDQDFISNLNEYQQGSNPEMAASSFTLTPVASGAGIDGSTNQNWELDGEFESEGPFSKWVIEKWRSNDGTQKQERRIATEFELAPILLDDKTVIVSAKLTMTLLGKWGDAGLLSYVQTHAYVGDGIYQATDLNDVSNKVAETNPNNTYNGQTFTIDITDYINNLGSSDPTIIGLVQSIYYFTDRMDFEKDLKLDIKFEYTP